MPDKVHIHQDAVLYINHPDVQVQSLDLQGALVVEAQQGTAITIDGLKIQNEGWEWQPLHDNDTAAEHEMIRYGMQCIIWHTCDEVVTVFCCDQADSAWQD